MEYITGKDLYSMFQYGSVFVSEKRKHLNDINVFPVPDGDTGNNLTHTLQVILRDSMVSDNFSETLDSISEAALKGARGNSGVIFAQFINGINMATNNEEKVTISSFREMVESGYKYTYSALSNPVDGTMVSLMKHLSNFVEKGSSRNKTIQEIFVEVYNKAKTWVESSKTKLKVLEDNDVVDSGALGFLMFLKGIKSYYNKEEIEVVEQESIVIEDPHDFEGEIINRYCTEGLVSYSDLDEESVKKLLDNYGDSSILAVGKNKFRVHVHTNKPDQFFQELKQFGTLEYQKADDMLLEMNLKNTEKRRVLVTDSIADISKELLDENNVVVVPVNVQLDEVSYIDKLTMNNTILFGQLNSLLEYPTTASISIKYMNDLFSKLLLSFDEILVVTVSKELSVTHDVILGEAKKVSQNGKKVYVVDSKNNSASEGLIVQKAMELLHTEKSLESIVKELEDYREKSQILVCLDTFKYATMSGRVPKVVGKIGMAIGLRPIMSLKDGKGAAFGFAFSKKSITKKITKLVLSDMEKSGIERYSIVHCLNKKLAKEYTELFTRIIGKKPEYITEISSATAIHSGVGSVAIGYIKER